MLKKLTFVNVLLLTSTLVFSVPAAASNQESWVMPDEYGPGFFQFAIQDPPTGIYHSQLTAYSGSNTLLCRSVEDPFCSSAEQFTYASFIPVCNDEVKVDCIRSISALDMEGKIYESKFQRYATPNHPNEFSGADELLLPPGTSPSMWEFQDPVHPNGKQVAISIGMNGGFLKNAKTVSRENFFLNLHAISLQEGYGANVDSNGMSNFHKCMQKQDASTARFFLACGAGSALNSKYNCAIQLIENGNCWLMQPFHDDFRFQVVIDLAEEPAGWFHGRMKDPEVDIRPLDKGVRITVVGSPTQQPVFYWGKEFNQMSESIQKVWQECLPKGTCSSGSRLINSDKETDFNKKNVLFYPRPVGVPLMKFMETFLPEVGDRAATLLSAWNLRTLSPGEMAKSERCFRTGNGVKGIVTTNATVYSEGPPLFNGSSLEYQVSSPHYTPDEKEFRGNYNLLVKSDVARCLFGFSNAPITASIEVYGADGEKSIATTSVSEKDGWLSLAAHNFTFSTPTIRATISQSAPSTTPTSTPENSRSLNVMETSNRVKQKAITCKKGKKTKRVTAVKSLCPRGWKKT